MIRFVVGPDDSVVPDIAEKLPGRGLWVKADRAALDKAVAKSLFARAAKAPAKAHPELARQVEALLARKCLDLLGQAMGAGCVVLGSANVGALLRDAEAELLLEAEDGAEDGRRKVLGALKAGALTWDKRGQDATLVAGCFSAEELSLALGRENVIHAAVKAGGLTNRLLKDVRRLGGFRPLKPHSWASIRGGRRPPGDAPVSDA